MAAQEVVTLNTATPQLEAPQAGSTYTFPRAITGTTAFGVAGSSLGAISFSGNTSGTVTVQPAAAAGTWTFTLPTTAGTNTYALLTNGSGVSSWGQIAIGTAVSGLGTGVATALAVNVGTAGAPVVLNGALGTPSSGTLTNTTGLPISSGVSGLGANVATALATFSSANIKTACTDETGSGGALVFATGPTLTDPLLTVSTPAVSSIGFLGVPQMADQDDYTMVLADAGGCYYHVSATPHTLTIPANASVAYPIGTTIEIANESGAGALTIAINSDTLRWGSSTGSRTMAANGNGVITKRTATLWRLTGEGIT